MLLPRLFRLGNLVMRASARVRYRSRHHGALRFYAMPRRRGSPSRTSAGARLALERPLVSAPPGMPSANYFKMFADFMLMDTLTPEQIRRMVRPRVASGSIVPWPREKCARGHRPCVELGHPRRRFGVYGYPSAPSPMICQARLNELVIASASGSA